MSKGITIKQASNGYILTKTWDNGQEVVICERYYTLAEEVFNWFRDEYTQEMAIIGVPPAIQYKVKEFARTLTDAGIW